MTCRPVRCLTCALVAAAAWLAVRNAPTTAQTPPAATDVEKRLKALEDKLDKLTQLLTPREARPAQGTTAQILSDTVERLRAERAAKEKQLADWRTTNDVRHETSIEDGIKRLSERLSKIETRRAEFRLEKVELEEKLRQIEKAYKEGGIPAAMNRIQSSGLNSQVVERVSKYEEDILKLQLQKKKASAMYDANHPIMKALDEEIELYRQLAGKAFKNLDGEGDKADKAKDTPTKVIKALKERIDGLDMMLRTLDNMFQQDQTHARELIKAADEEKKLLADVDRARRALAAVQAALLDLDKPAK